MFGLPENQEASRNEELRSVSRLDPNVVARQPSITSAEVDQDYDLLDDIDKHKDIYRLKVDIYVNLYI